MLFSIAVADDSTPIQSDHDVPWVEGGKDEAEGAGLPAREPADPPTTAQEPEPSNPFQEGCLRSFLGEKKFPEKRVCNSDDLKDSQLE